MPREQEGLYIHLDDPGFPDRPWAGGRRLGPFHACEESGLSAEEVALGQAVSDYAGGAYVPLGIFDDENSRMLDDPTDVEVADSLMKLKEPDENDPKGLERAEAIIAARKAVKNAKPVVSAAAIRKAGEREKKRREKEQENRLLAHSERVKALQGLIDSPPEGGLRAEDLLGLGLLG